jgi:hypothetical protein
VFLFQYDPTTRILERINILKIKCADQRFGLGFKPRMKDYKRVAMIKKEKQLARIKGREPNEDRIEISPIHVIRTEDELKSLGKKFNDITNNFLEGFKEEDHDGDFEARKDTHKMIPQLTINIMEYALT